MNPDPGSQPPSPLQFECKAIVTDQHTMKCAFGLGEQRHVFEIPIRAAATLATVMEEAMEKAGLPAALQSSNQMLILFKALLAQNGGSVRLERESLEFAGLRKCAISTEKTFDGGGLHVLLHPPSDVCQCTKCQQMAQTETATKGKQPPPPAA